MPRSDGTGPAGHGPFTGRGFGYCAGFTQPGYAHCIPARGIGYRYGRHIGFHKRMGWNCHVPNNEYHKPSQKEFMPTVTDEITILKNQAKYFEDALEFIKKRMSEIEEGK